MPLHKRQRVPIFLLANVLARVLDIQDACQLAGPGDFVSLSFIFGEAHGKRLNVGVHFGQTGRHVTGVDAAGKEAAHLHIGYVVVLDAFGHGLVDCTSRFVEGAVFLFVERRLPIAL